MKKTIITCLSVSCIALSSFFYADQSFSPKHTSDIKEPITDLGASGTAIVKDKAHPASHFSGESAQSSAIKDPVPILPTDSDALASRTTQNKASDSPHDPLKPIAPANDPSPTSNEVVQLLQSADISNPEERQRVVAQMTQIEEARMDGVLEKAEQLGIPVRIDAGGGKISVLHGFRGDQPLYRTTNNRNAAISTGANILQTIPYGLDGAGVKVGVWDAGSIRNTHRELTGRVTKKNATSVLDDHSTHVAGTIASSGVDANAKGMAPRSTIDSYDWDNDYAEMTATGAATATDLTGVSLSNHSYGYGANSDDMGRYEKEAQTVDALVWAMPYYLPLWAAGNEQDSLTALGGYQSITFNSLAKNILTIGAVNDAVVAGIRTPSSGSMSTFSSWGPTDDGRIKPDLVANGVSVYSSTAGSDSSYDGTYSGTSMATPNAAGSTALLQQLYANSFGQRPRASLLKALLIHTADDLGNPGPDYKFGWGLINLKAAADIVLAHKATPSAPRIHENALTSTLKTTTTTFTWDGVSPIRATLSWTDPAGAPQTAADSRTPNVVHDLDLKITGPDGATTYLPYVMPFVGAWTAAAMSASATTGKNRADNTEQVYISNPNRSGTYTVTVSMEGQLTTNSQPYALVVTGVSGTITPPPTPTPTPSPTPTPLNPAPTVSLTSPTNGSSITLGAQFTLAANAADLTSNGAVGVVSKVEFFNGTTSLGAATTAPYSITWKPTTSGNYILIARATDNQGATGTSATATVSVLAPLPAPTISSFAPTSGFVGTSVVINGTNLSSVTGVQFNGIPASVWKIVSATQLSATIPLGATTGPIKVTTPTTSATSSASFTITTPLTRVVISQIYAGGGRWWSDYSHDYIELHNPDSTPVRLDGWTLQLAGGSGSRWIAVSLKGSIPAKGYYLVALAGGQFEYDLPKADASGYFDLAVKQGKVALMRNSTLLNIPSPLGLPQLSDLVGYGSANAYEGSSPAISPERYDAIFRANAGATDTNDNYKDFDWGYAAPRNSATPVTLRKNQLLPRKSR